MSMNASRDFLLVLTSPVGGREEEFEEWYEHHAREIAALDGFAGAYRFHSAEPNPGSPACPHRHLAMYEVEPGRLATARASMLAMQAERSADNAAGRTPRVPVSDALDTRHTESWWFVAVRPPAA